MHSCFVRHFSRWQIDRWFSSACWNVLNCSSNSEIKSFYFTHSLPFTPFTFQITVHFMLGFREICSVTAALPLVTMFICFVSAVVFQFDDVHETHCRVNIHQRDSQFLFSSLSPFTNAHFAISSIVSAGFQFYTIDKCHNRRKSTAIFLANKYCFACGTAIHHRRML